MKLRNDFAQQNVYSKNSKQINFGTNLKKAEGLILKGLSDDFGKIFENGFNKAVDIFEPNNPFDHNINIKVGNRILNKKPEEVKDALEITALEKNQDTISIDYLYNISYKDNDKLKSLANHKANITFKVENLEELEDGNITNMLINVYQKALDITNNTLEKLGTIWG